MKKFFSLLLVFTLALSMIPSTFVAAAQKDEVPVTAAKINGLISGDISDIIDNIAGDEGAVQTLLNLVQTVIDFAQSALDDAKETGISQDKLDKINDWIVKAQNALTKVQDIMDEVQDALSSEERAKIQDEMKKLEQKIRDLSDQVAEIKTVDISDYEATLEKTSYQYTGKPIEPAVKVVGLSESDYTVTYTNNVAVGTATVTIKAKGDKYKGTITKTFTITGSGNGTNTTKKANTLAVKGNSKTAIVKYGKLKKKAQTVKASKVIKITDKGQGKLAYQIKSVKKGKKSFKKYFKINAGNGKVTVKKGLKKGTYKIKITVTAAGNDQYNNAAKDATSKIKVR